MYTVKDVARISGISVRALHHYDEIGLLKPAFVGENRYRYYGRDELLRLQQILLYREFGVPLAEIIDYLDQPDYDVAGALQAHKAKLATEARRYRRLTALIDRKIANLQTDLASQGPDGGHDGAVADRPDACRSWLIAERDEMRRLIDLGQTRPSDLSDLSDLSQTDRDRVLSEGQAVEVALADEMRAGQPADSASLDDLLSRHRALIALLWARDCPPHAYGRLADLYRSHPDFRRRCEDMAIGFSDYLPAAMEAYATRHKS